AGGAARGGGARRGGGAVADGRPAGAERRPLRGARALHAGPGVRGRGVGRRGLAIAEQRLEESSRGEHPRVLACPRRELHRGGQPLLGGTARQRERGPSERADGIGERYGAVDGIDLLVTPTVPFVAPPA